MRNIGCRSRFATPLLGQSMTHCTKFWRVRFAHAFIANRYATPSPPQQHGSLSRGRSEEHTSELQSLMRISYAVFCLKKKTHYERDCTLASHALRTDNLTSRMYIASRLHPPPF